MHRIYCSPEGSGNRFSEERPGSLYDAVDRVEELAGKMEEDIEVVLLNGTYELDRPIRLNAGHSGRNGYRVIFEASERGKASLSGGRKLGNWQPEEDHPSGAWVCRVSPGLTLRQLYVNGVRANRAAWTELPSMERTEWGYSLRDETFGALCCADLLEFVYEQQWTQCRIGVERVEANGRRIVMKQPAFRLALEKRGVSIDLPVRAEGLVEAVARPGDWAYDRQRGLIYYVPRHGEDMLCAEAVVPMLEALLIGEGVSEAPLTDVVIRGLHFCEAAWLQPNSPEGYAEVQAMLCATPDNPGAADSDKDRMPEAHVRFHAARRLRIEGNTFSRLGGVALSLDRGAQENDIVGNDFFDVSGTAVQLGGISAGDYAPGSWKDMTRGNVVRHNRIRRIGVEYAGAVGIWCGYTADTVIAHNELSELPYSAISIGWGWGNRDRAPVTRNNRITNNRIAGVMNVLWDGGGIYSLAAQPNQLISDNVVSGVRNREAAIYLDNKSRYNTVQGNVLYDNFPGKHMHFNDNVGDISVQWNVMDFSAELDEKEGIRYAGNRFVPVEAMPLSVLENAGIQEPYRTLLGLGAGRTKEDAIPPIPGPLRVRCVDRNADGFELEWDLPSLEDPVHSGRSYEVTVNGQVACVTTESGCRVEGLRANTLYKAEVRAQNGDGGRSEAVEAPTIRTLPAFDGFAQEEAEMPESLAHVSILLDVDESRLIPGTSFRASLVGYSNDGAAWPLEPEGDEAPQWGGDRAELAIVSSDGRIAALGDGTFRLTAEYRDGRGLLHVATKKLRIRPAEVAGLSWSEERSTLFLSEAETAELLWRAVLNSGETRKTDDWTVRAGASGKALAVEDVRPGGLKLRAAEPGESELIVELAHSASGLSHFARKRVCVLPAEWKAAVIGPDYGDYSVVALPESGLLLRSRGEDIWGTSDECLFLYKELELSPEEGAELEIRATIETLGDAHPSTMTGLMLRLGLEPDAPNAMFRLHAETGKPNKFSPITYRTEKGGETRHLDVGSLTLPAELKLTAKGGEAFAWKLGANGNWEPAGAIRLPGWTEGTKLYAGIAHCSHERKRSSESRVCGANVVIRQIGRSERSHHLY